MIHWNAHLVCNWLHSQPAESFLFCPCDVGRPSNSFDLIETRSAHGECSELNKGNRWPCCMQVLWIKTMYAFENGFFPPRPPIPHSRTVQPLWAVINCYCQRHNQEQGEKKILQHLSWAQPQYPHRHTQERTKMHTRRMDVTIDFWADVRDIAQIQKPGYKRCFCLSRAIIVLQHQANDWLYI